MGGMEVGGRRQEARMQPDGGIGEKVAENRRPLPGIDPASTARPSDANCTAMEHSCVFCFSRIFKLFNKVGALCLQLFSLQS